MYLTAFNYQLLDEVVDFYVIQTLRYRQCKYQRHMKKPTTQGDMVKYFLLLLTIHLLGIKKTTTSNFVCKIYIYILFFLIFLFIIGT